MDASQIGFAFLLSIIAGLSTGIGSLISLAAKQPCLKYLSFSLGLSAGVMLYVSFIELLPEGFESIGELGGLFVFLGGLGFGAPPNNVRCDHRWNALFRWRYNDLYCGG